MAVPYLTTDITSSTTGVYKITNIVNNKFYIGSCSSKKGMRSRLSDHVSMLRSNKHHSIHLQRSWNKNGESNFKFELIENCLPDKCIEREQYYIDTLKPHYNICKNARSRLGCKNPNPTRWNEEQRKAISLRQKGKINIKMIEAAKKSNTGRKWDKETIEKRAEGIRKAWAKFTPEERSKIMIKKQKNRDLNYLYKPLLAKNLITNEEFYFKSLNDAANQFKIDKGNLTKYVNKKPYKKLWIFTYVEKQEI